MNPIESPLSGRVLAVHVAVGDSVAPGTPLMTIESMKMEIPVEAEAAGRVEQLGTEAGADVSEGDVLLWTAKA